MAVVAVLLAHTMKGIAIEQFQQSAGTVVHLISTATGWVGVIILILSIVKINDWNLYPSSLGIANSVDALIGTRWNRVYVAMALGLFGSILSAAGFADFFQPFLIELGTAFPPIAAIMIVDYFVLKTWRRELDESRENGFRLPTYAPQWVAGGLIAWVVGYAVSSPMLLGRFVSIGVPSINSLVVGGLVYWILAGPLGLNGKSRAQVGR